MTFGQKVKYHRKNLKITQDELARRIGVTRRVVTSYENDQSRPRGIAGYQRLADALGVNINLLLSVDEAFIANAEEEFGYRGKIESQKILDEVTGLFSGGEMEEEDMDELMLAIQQAYVTAKRRNRKNYAKKTNSGEK